MAPEGGSGVPASGAALHWLIAPSVLLILTCYLLLALGCLGSHGREPIKTYIFLIYLFFSSLVAPQGGAVATSGASATSAGGALQWPSVRCCNNRWHTGTTTLSGDSPAVSIRACVFLSVQWLAFPGFQWSCAFHTCEHRWPKWLRQSFVSESCSAQWAAEKLKVESWNLAMQGAHSCALVIIWSVIEIVGNGWIRFCPLECQLCVKTTKGWICPRVFSIHSVHLWAPLRFLTAAVLMRLRLWRCWQQ